MSIIIGADLVPTDSNYKMFIAGDAVSLVGSELMEILSQAEWRICNLEVPLVDEESPIQKCGPNLIAPCATIHGYTALGINVLTLANNHIMDQGEKGLNSTIHTLDEAGIAYVGVGKTVSSAAEPYVVISNNKRIGIYACAEHEFSIATDSCSGANPYDALESFDHVSTLKKNCEYVIVLYHGGKEHYRYPSPMLQRICRKFIEKGADLVVCQHSHCIGCEENYLNGTIVYGQGNFLFDHNNSEFWKTSLLIRISDDFQVSYIPLTKKDNVVRIADSGSSEVILNEFMNRSRQITESRFVEKNYREFSKNMIANYLFVMAGKLSLFGRIMNRILPKNMYQNMMLKEKYKNRYQLAMRNYVECEAHRELFLKGLESIED